MTEHMTTAICPGSFDPVTLGHLDIISRASKIFDRIIVAVPVNPDKRYSFTVEERLEMLRRVCETAGLLNVEHMFLSSSMVKQVAGFGGDISHFVPGCILETIRERLCAE